MSRSRAMGSSLVVLFAASGCFAERTTEPAVQVGVEPSLSITGTCKNSGGVSISGFVKNWACNDVVFLSTSANMTSTEISALQSAVSRWNFGVLNKYGLPKFSMSSGNRTMHVTLTVLSANGDYYCGQVPDKTHLNISRSATSTCSHPGRISTATVDDLLLHELSHAIGFQGGGGSPGADWHKPSDPQYTGHCAVALYYSGRPLNTDLCQHEVEVIYAAYALRSTAPNLFKHVMTGLAGLGPLSLEVGQTGTLSVTALRFVRANGTFCTPAQPDTTACEIATRSPSEASFSWSHSNGEVASLSGSGASRTVTATAPGKDTVAVNATATAYERAAAFGDPGTGTTAVVTVTAPPPPPDASIVGNYTSSTNTIRSNQTCKFKAFSSGAAYAWYRKNEGTTVWKPVGTTQEISQSTGTKNFRLKVVVTVGSQSDSDSLSLNVRSDGVLCDGY